MRKPRKSGPRSGFTIVELLVVVSIIGILTALLLPAVMNAREFARRKQCANNLHQLGTAVLAYLSQHQMVPFSISPWPEYPGDTRPKSGKGWIVSILPNLEQRNLFKDFKLTGDFFTGFGLKDPDPMNRAAVAMNLEVLHCPADPASLELSTTQAEWSGISVALTNYKGCIGDTEIGTLPGQPKLSTFSGTTPDCYNSSPCNGIFWPKSSMFLRRWDRFPDGPTHTFLIGEDVPKYNNHSAWAYANGDFASCHVPLNYMPDPPQPTNFADAISFRSMHKGGANFCFADGSVHWINEMIRLDVYRALSTRDGKMYGKNEGALSDDDENIQ